MTTSNKQNERWNMLVQKGKDAGKRRDLAASAEYFSAAYEVSKDFPSKDNRRAESAYFLAYTRYIEKNTSEAIRLLNEFLKRSADQKHSIERQAQTHSLLGSIYFGVGELELAESHIRESLEIESTLKGPSWENEQFLASILMMQKKYQEAIPFLNAVFERQKRQNVPEAQKLAVMIAFAHKQLNDEKGEFDWQKQNLTLREQLTPQQPAGAEDSLSADELPEGWGLDQLGHFLEACRQNELSTFVQKPSLYQELSKLNDRFIENRKSMVIALTQLVIKRKSTEEFSQIKLDDQDWLEVYFYLRCHASFTAATRLALSAQAPETYMVLRGCIENALYAWHVSSDDNLKVVWLNRHKDAASAKAVKSQFAIGDMKRNLTAKDTALGDRVTSLYDETIDRGAHPNVMAFIDNAGQRNSDGTLLLSVSTLNPSQLDEILNATVTVGELIFDIYKLIYPNLID